MTRWILLALLGYLLGGLFLASANAAQVLHRHTMSRTIVPSETLISLDAPPKGDSEWSLLVTVGDTTFAVPRVELRKLAVAHLEWRTK